MVSQSGQIHAKTALDYEVTNFYEFYVTTVDGQNSQDPSSTATVRVTVLVRGIIVMCLFFPSLCLHFLLSCIHSFCLAFFPSFVFFSSSRIDFHQLGYYSSQPVLHNCGYQCICHASTCVRLQTQYTAELK